MKYQLLIFALFFCLSNIQGQKKKILIVSTNVDSVGTHRSGSYLMEIAYPFQEFINNGFDVDILTPLGGQAAIYDNGKVAEDLLQIAQSDLFKNKTSHTISPDKIVARNYVAVFYPGGHGQYFDVIDDERIAGIAAAIYEKGGFIGTAGHGAASLINIRLSNCEYLVKGKTITCFPAWAEKAYMNISNYGKLLPFDMQAVLGRRGANLVVCADETSRKDLSKTNIVDRKNRMVTGSFAGSAKWVAEQLIALIKN